MAGYDSIGNLPRRGRPRKNPSPQAYMEELMAEKRRDTRVILGSSFDEWTEFRRAGGYASDAQFASALLSCYKLSTAPKPTSSASQAAAALVREPRVIDLRSDTVTKPTPAMRQAMAEAVVGDDVCGEDPTVKDLQEKAAQLLGKEAALFVPSGTMGNLICVMVHCWHRGAEVLLGDKSHLVVYEQGGLSQIAGVHPRSVTTLPDGRLDLVELERKVRKDPNDPHLPTTSLICLENTHNICGGRALRPEYMMEVGDVAKRHALPVHVDGARLLNAATSLGVHPSELLKMADSASVCLSKGLAAPVGSVIVGSHDFIKRATRVRKVLGGGMRQAGVLAAPGLLALEVMSQRLAEDHRNAMRLAEGLHAMAELGVDVDLSSVESNIVIFKVTHSSLTPEELCHLLGNSEGDVSIMMWPYGPGVIRAVTHYHVTAEDIDIMLTKTKKILTGLSS